MNDEPEIAAPSAALLAQIYLIVGLVADVGLGVAMLQKGPETFAVLPALVGAAGLIFRWRLASFLVFATTTIVLITPWFFGARREPTLGVDLLLCASTLVFAVAHQRLLALELSLLPADSRRPRATPPTRAIDASAVREVPGVLIAAVGATVAAFFLWEMTAALPAPWGIPRRDWRVGQVIWALTLTLVALTSTIGYLGWRRQAPAQAELFLRDVFWKETRGEQRSVSRWRTYGLRRRERRERI